MNIRDPTKNYQDNVDTVLAMCSAGAGTELAMRGSVARTRHAYTRPINTTISRPKPCTNMTIGLRNKLSNAALK